MGFQIHISHQTFHNKPLTSFNQDTHRKNLKKSAYYDFGNPITNPFKSRVFYAKNKRGF